MSLRRFYRIQSTGTACVLEVSIMFGCWRIIEILFSGVNAEMASQIACAGEWMAADLSRLVD